MILPINRSLVAARVERISSASRPRPNWSSGRFAQKHAGKRGRNRPETIYFLGLTLYCTRNQKGNFKVGMRTEISAKAQPYVSARANAANTTSYNQ